MYKSAIILAAGQGTRIKSNIPKVLHKVCGKEMVNQVIDVLRLANINDINVVIGKGADLVKEKTKNRAVNYSKQEQQLGTGHAVMSAEDFLRNKKGVVAVLCGDTPLITKETIESLFDIHIKSNNSITVITSILDDATGYGRIVRNGEEVLKIVEHKDCNPEELNIKEMNAGMYCFDIENLLESLQNISNNNAQGEYYLTDVIGIQKSQGKKIGALTIPYEETIGVNSRKQLSQAEKALRTRINEYHMDNGVTLIDPENTYIGSDVVIGKDTIIYPNTIIEGSSIIGENCIIYSKCRIENSRVSDNSKLEDCILVNGEVIKPSNIGEYSYVKPIVLIEEDTRLNSAVEIKKVENKEAEMQINN